MSDVVPGTASATSEDGRFVLFDADATEPAPDEGPFDPWVSAMADRGLAVAWTGPAPGRRVLRVVMDAAVADVLRDLGEGCDADSGVSDADGDDTDRGGPLGGHHGEHHGGHHGEHHVGGSTRRARLDLPSGRLCFAGLDEAFAARNAELHPGAFGDVLELQPGTYDLELAPVRWLHAPDARAARRRARVRRGDEFIAALVRGGVPLALVGGLLMAGVAIAAGAWLSRAAGAGTIAMWTLGLAGVALAAFAIVVRAGAMPPLHRVLAARRALATAHPDAVLALRRVGDVRSDAGQVPRPGAVAGGEAETVAATGSAT